MSEAIDPETVRHVANLARLELDDAQVEAYRSELASVLSYVERLRSIDLDGVEPMSHPIEASNRLDSDTPRDPMPTRVLLDIAPESMGAFIKVPKVLGSSES